MGRSDEPIMNARSARTPISPPTIGLKLAVVVAGADPYCKIALSCSIKGREPCSPSAVHAATMRARAATIAAAMQVNFRQRHVPVSKLKHRRGKGGAVALESDKSLRTLAALSLHLTCCSSTLAPGTGEGRKSCQRPGFENDGIPLLKPVRQSRDPIGYDHGYAKHNTGLQRL